MPSQDITVLEQASKRSRVAFRAPAHCPLPTALFGLAPRHGVHGPHGWLEDTSGDGEIDSPGSCECERRQP